MNLRIVEVVYFKNITLKEVSKMEKSQDGEESKKCCPGGGHCGTKVVAAIVLILLGWICGYMMGSGGGWCRKNKSMRDHTVSAAMMDCPMMKDAKAPAPK